MIAAIQGTTWDIHVNGVLLHSIKSNVNVTTNNMNIKRWQNGARPFNDKVS